MKIIIGRRFSMLFNLISYKRLPTSYKITLVSLFLLAFAVNLALVDSYIIPQKTESDLIVSYSAIEQTIHSRFGKSTSYLGFRFLTRKGYKFSIDKTFIENPEITIGSSRIFENVINVYNGDDDYSEKLLSGLNGVNLYVCLILSVSSIVSILVLLLNRNLSHHGFKSIVTFHLFMIFIIAVIYNIV